MIGQSVKHYKVTEKLGEGGMGVVYKAHDTKLDRTVALKFLPTELSASKDSNKRFFNEAKAASALHHNNTCTIFEIDETDTGQLYIVMPAYDGKSLDEKIGEGELGIEQSLDIAIQIGEGLKAAHEQGIIHRDIKSGNIMITEAGQAVIMDFGLARRKDASKLTKTGQTPGTIPYMSPEQATGEEIDQRTDIWSLGVVLYEMLSGRNPFPSEYPQAIIYSILNEDPKPVDSLVSGIPFRLSSAVQKAMAKDKKERYQSVAEMLQDLRDIKEHFNSKSSQSGNGISRLFQNKKLPVPLLLGVLFSALAGLFLVSYLLFSPVNEKELDEASIAVLPFETLGGNQNSTFTKGIHGGLLTRLSNIAGLKVTSRTSTLQYLNNIKPIPEIAQELNVDWIVRGEVQETSDQVQVDARLVYAPEDRQVWASNYRRVLTANNLFEIQSDLALEIISELETRLSSDEKNRVERKPTENLNAFRLFIEGISLLEQRTPKAVLASVDYFMKAIEEDPDYAPAWAVLGEALIYIDFYKYNSMDNYSISPREATAKALSLNPDLAEAHASQGILLYTQKKGTQAIAELERAIELQPSLETAQNWLGFLHLLMGQPEDAVDHARRAIELNPLAPASHLYPSLTYLANGNAKEALREVRRAKEIQPQWGEIYAFEAVMLYHNKRYEEALEALAIADSLIGSEAKSVWIPDISSIKELAKLAIGDTLSSHSTPEADTTGINPFWIGITEAALDKQDLAMTSFNEIEQFSMWPNLSLRYYFPEILDSLRRDSRFEELIERMDRQWE